VIGSRLQRIAATAEYGSYAVYAQTTNYDWLGLGARLIQNNATFVRRVSIDFYNVSWNEQRRDLWH
jgi:hypothetical protein